MKQQNYQRETTLDMDFNHINRVLDLSLKFAEKENANKYIVSLIALLHDADDYKLFGMENAEKLTKAK